MKGKSLHFCIEFNIIFSMQRIYRSGKTFARIFCLSTFLCPKMAFLLNPQLNIYSESNVSLLYDSTLHQSCRQISCGLKKWKLFICMESRDQNEYIDGKTCRDGLSGVLSGVQYVMLWKCNWKGNIRFSPFDWPMAFFIDVLD